MAIAHLSRTHGSIHADVELLPTLLQALRAVDSQCEQVVQPHVGSALPTACIDGRSAAIDEADRCEVSAGELRLAGGTLSPWIGAILGASTCCEPAFPDSDTAVVDLGNFCAAAHARQLPVATHCDDHAPHGRCGCGAADVMGAILDVLSMESDYIHELLTSWGFAADLSGVARQAQALKSVFTDQGLALHQAIARHCDSDPARLAGAHREVAVIVNLRPSTVVRRDVVEEILAEHGLPGAQVFVVDMWACRALVKELGLPSEAADACAAFNVAAALTLCGSNSRVVTIS